MLIAHIRPYLVGIVSSNIKYRFLVEAPDESTAIESCRDILRQTHAELAADLHKAPAEIRLIETRKPLVGDDSVAKVFVLPAKTFPR